MVACSPPNPEIPNPLPPSPPPHPPWNSRKTVSASEATPSDTSQTALMALCFGVGLGGLIVLFAVCLVSLFRRMRKAKQIAHKLSSTKHDKRNGSLSLKDGKAKTIVYLDVRTSFIVPISTTDDGDIKKTLSTANPECGLSSRIFSFAELARETDNFSSTNLLGQGGFGYVHKGVLSDGTEVAVKQLKYGSGQGEREFQAEVDTISRVKHMHLVSLIGYCISGDERLLVYEFVPNKTLEFHLHVGTPPLIWSIRLKIALGAARGLAYLHEDCRPKIIHRDIKASNILLDDNFEAKVADFGLAKFSNDNDTHVSTRVMGTFGYLAPEYASSGKLTEKSDVFSFGVVVLELITGRRPIDKGHCFMDDSMVEWARPLLREALEIGKFEGLVDPNLKEYNISEMSQMVACAAACVQHSARRRPRMSQIVEALEGNLSIDELCSEMSPSSSAVGGGSDYDTYRDDLKKFRKVALESQDMSTCCISAVHSDVGPLASISSTDNQQEEQANSKKHVEEILEITIF